MSDGMHLELSSNLDVTRGILILVFKRPRTIPATLNLPGRFLLLGGVRWVGIIDYRKAKAKKAKATQQQPTNVYD